MRAVDVRPWWLLVVSCALWGCGDECSQAVSLCEDCELRPEKCETLYEDATADFCRSAIEDYEASCSE